MEPRTSRLQVGRMFRRRHINRGVFCGPPQEAADASDPESRESVLVAVAGVAAPVVRSGRWRSPPRGGLRPGASERSEARKAQGLFVGKESALEVRSRSLQ